MHYIQLEEPRLLSAGLSEAIEVTINHQNLPIRWQLVDTFDSTRTVSQFCVVRFILFLLFTVCSSGRADA